MWGPASSVAVSCVMRFLSVRIDAHAMSEGSIPAGAAHALLGVDAIVGATLSYIRHMKQN